jgi:hypothetical protein
MATTSAFEAKGEMKSGKEWLIFLSGGFMALIWRYAWANFITLALSHRPFPLPEAIGTFGLASLVTFTPLGRGWRIIWILCLQVFGFVLASMRTVYACFDWSYPFLNPQWIVEFVTRARGFLEWFSLGLILFWVILFWIGGFTLARKPRDYFNLCSRFDLGVCFFFVLLLINFLLRVKGGTTIQHSLIEPLLFSFFLFSVLGIALARNQSHAHREFLPRYRGIGVMLSFSLIVLLFGAGVVSILLPYLKVIAQAGYGVIKIAAKPLGLVIVSVLRFILTPQKMRRDSHSTSGSGDTDHGSLDSGGGTSPVEEAVVHFFMGLVVLIGLMFTALLLWLFLRWLLSWLFPRLFSWLFSRTSTTHRRDIRLDIRNLLLLVITGLRAPLLLCRQVLGLMKHREKGAVQLYTALLRWGRRSGVPRLANETPREYGSRLKRQFPAVTREVTSIVEAFNQTVYGGIVLKDHRLALTQAAWRTLRSPLDWMQRLKVWFLGPGKDEAAL